MTNDDRKWLEDALDLCKRAAASNVALLIEATLEDNTSITLCSSQDPKVISALDGNPTSVSDEE